MRRRVHVEFLGHKEIKITNFAFQKVFDLEKLKTKGERFIDLINLKTFKPLVGSNQVPFYLEIRAGTGKLGDPFYLMAAAMTTDSQYSDVSGGFFTIYTGKEKTIEVDFPDAIKPKRR